jgi:hypothetical protein
MKKTGILTFHYSCNYGAVLQSYALYDYLASKNVDVEIINCIRSTYRNDKIYCGTGLGRGADLGSVLKRIRTKRKFNKNIIMKFNRFRNTNLRMSAEVDEKSIITVLGDYETIIVGSDQVWNPSQRSKSLYFLGFDEFFRGNKISYAVDSTVSEIDPKHVGKLKKELHDFNAISVRNRHSQEFVERLTGKVVPIVADPTVLCDFSKLGSDLRNHNERYIFAYVLGKDIEGTNKRAIERIKQVHGDLQVYAAVDPTKAFNVNIRDYADRVFYDLDPVEWIDMLRNARFVYTDSFHGTLLSLKFHKPFLAYYVEDMRATRFMDLANRYKIDKFIVSSVDGIDTKESLQQSPDFGTIDYFLEDHKRTSTEFLHTALNID